jgi:hypothetical protein
MSNRFPKNVRQKAMADNTTMAYANVKGVTNSFNVFTGDSLREVMIQFGKKLSCL